MLHSAPNRPIGPQSAPRVRQSTPSAEKSRVLIVDDEAGVRNLLYDVLSLTHNCERASNGAEAMNRQIASASTRPAHRKVTADT